MHTVVEIEEFFRRLNIATEEERSKFRFPAEAPAKECDFEKKLFIRTGLRTNPEMEPPDA
jgi:hypothetical protein